MPHDDVQGERIRDDLKGLIRGDLHFDDLSRLLYSTDASIFQVWPLGVVAPRDEDDVRALVRYAAENEVPLIARGAGTGMAGESLGRGVVVDLSRHFRDIVEIGDETVRVQPGVTYRALSSALARIGRRFAPDPAHVECTLGGMLATNASGSRAIRHGYTRDHVAALRVILDTGEGVSVAREPRHPLLAPAETAPQKDSKAETRPAYSSRLADIVTSVATLLEQQHDLLERCRSRTHFNRCGYAVHDVVGPAHIDLVRLLVGSEGTLALFTEATLRTAPLPGGQAVLLFCFDRLAAALQAVQLLAPTGLSACELLDRRLVSLARATDEPASWAAQVPATTEAILLVEYEGDHPAEVEAEARRQAERLLRQEKLAQQVRLAVTPEEAQDLWSVREAVLPGLYGLRGGTQPLPFIEDIGVPPDALPEFLEGVQRILQRQEVTASFLAHAAAGQVHTRPFLDLGNPADAAKLGVLADEVYTLALELGGTISTQHGTGLARTPWVEQQFGALYPVLREIKAIFDPRHLFNPGKIIGSSARHGQWPLRQTAKEGMPAEPAAILPLPPVATRALRWELGEALVECETCNGCGHCRTEAPAARMCPLFRADHTEAATPRAKANLLRWLLQQPDPEQALASPAVREIADLCVNCKMCAIECPAHVRIPKLMLETKAANVARHGLDRADWVMARTESFAHVGSALAPIANALLGNHVVRWLLERFLGVSRKRRLPAFARQSFLRRAARRGWTHPPMGRRSMQRLRVAYFVDIFANYNDPLVAEAAVAVLHHNGVEVYVPPGQQGCGMAPLAYGDVETAREVVRHNVRLLADLVREGFLVVCTEPTAALMLRHDARDLLDDPDVQLVGEYTVEWTTFLWRLHERGRLRTDFSALDFSLGHHVPCHIKALGSPPCGPRLLALIPGVRVHTIDVSCSGMAGTFGLQSAGYQASLAAGRPMLDEMSRPAVQFGSTECSACRVQMEDGAGKRTLHPAQYLALAYGLLPGIAERLRNPMGQLVLS
jgi:FAD/FMN-containing dehydrogenase/Fe-S oxidoreductase